jgi:hypothetical protein
MSKSSGYFLTEYTRAVTPTQSWFKTKALALKEMSDCIKEAKIDYVKSGFKKVGTIKDERVTFEHPYYGVDYLVKIEEA